MSKRYRGSMSPYVFHMSRAYAGGVVLVDYFSCVWLFSGFCFGRCLGFGCEHIIEAKDAADASEVSRRAISVANVQM